MYEQTFNLTSRPFTSTPFVKHYFAAGSIKDALAQSRVAIDRGDGPVIVVGETGTGKSLLLAMLDDQYHSQYRVVTLGVSQFANRGDFLQNILFELQQPYRDMTESEMRLSLIDYLKPGERCPNGILLLIDEAERYSAELLDEVRLITNFVRNGQPRIRLVMAGTIGLEESLASPKLESFSQRIACRTYLSKLNREETAAYIKAHLERAGGDANSLFDENAMRLVHEQSDGSPRFINQICDHAMIIAATQGIQPITCQIVGEAWADVQNLPGSWQPAPAKPSPELAKDENWTVLEFGSLDDDESASFSPQNDSEETSQPALTPPSSSTSDTVIAEVSTEQEASEIQSLEQEQSELLTSVFGTDGIQQPESQSTSGLISESTGSHETLQGTQEPEAETPSTETLTEDVHTIESTSMEIPSTDSAACDAPTSEQPAEEETFATLNPTTFNQSQDTSDTVQLSELSDSIKSMEAPESSLPTDAEPLPLVSAEDPFASDTFEDEELLTDAYSPFVARQNQSSLSVSQDAIKHLTPLDAKTDQNENNNETTDPQAPQLASPRQSAPTIVEDTVVAFPSSENAPTSSETLNAFVENLQPESLNQTEAPQTESHQEPPSQLRATATTVTDDVPAPEAETTDLHVVDNDTSASQDSPPSSLPNNSIDESVQASPEPPKQDDKIEGYHVQAAAPDDDDIRRQAEEIMRSLQMDTNEEEVSHETAASLATPGEPVQTPTPASEKIESPGPATGPTTIDEESHSANALNQSQSILKQILEQQNVIGTDAQGTYKASQENNNQESTPVSIQYPQAQPPVAEPSRAIDDRDMLIVSETENKTQSPETTNEPLPPYSQEDPSTGRAERIDYQSLFDQLRNISED